MLGQKNTHKIMEETQRYNNLAFYYWSKIKETAEIAE